jgi:WD40 repeat protein
MMVDRVGILRLFDAVTGSEVALHRVADKSMKAISFSPNRRFVDVVTGSGTIQIWDVRTLRRVAVVEPRGSKIMQALAGFDGRLVAAEAQNSLEVWSASSGKWLTQLSWSMPQSGPTALSPDARLLATTAAGNVAVWDVNTGRRLALLAGHVQVNTVAFSPDGTRLATGDDAGTARIWDDRSGSLLAVLQGHTDYLNSVAFSPDNKFLVTASADGTTRVWDVLTGEQLAILGKAVDNLTGIWTSAAETAQFSQDDRLVVAGLVDGTTHIYRCDICSSVPGLLKLAEARTVRGLSPQERQRYLP